MFARSRVCMYVCMCACVRMNVHASHYVDLLGDVRAFVCVRVFDAVEILAVGRRASPRFAPPCHAMPFGLCDEAARSKVMWLILCVCVCVAMRVRMYTHAHVDDAFSFPEIRPR